MFGIRKDYLTGLQVLMADERSSRPQFFKQAEKVEVDEKLCPFCPENEHMLPNIIKKAGNGRITIADNKYPAVDLNLGRHYVIIDTNKHDEHFAGYSPENIALVIKELIWLYGKIMEKPEVEYVSMFKNDGYGSGASISHSHWQAVGLGFAGERAKKIHSAFDAFYRQNGISYIESLCNENERIIYKSDKAFIYAPYASFCSQVNIAPVRHVSGPAKLDSDEIYEIGYFLKLAVQVIYGLFGQLPFNICVQVPPKGNYPYSHFFIEVIPRIGNFAGMELGSGVVINSYYPEVIAPQMADILIKQLKSNIN